MRTKTLLLTAALAVGGVASSMAQAVYSANVVGYVNVTIPAATATAPNQFVAVNNPLNNGTNTLDEILPSAPVTTTTAFEFNPTTGLFATYVKRAAGWSGAAGIPFPPGKGFFIRSTAATPVTVTFVGEVKEGTATTPIGAGLNLIGSQFPLSGGVETVLSLPAVTGNLLYQFQVPSQNYATYTRRATGWTGGAGEPTIGVGEGFWFQVAAATSWTKTYTVPRP